MSNILIASNVDFDEPTYEVTDFSDSNYFLGPNGLGIAMPGTVAVVGVLKSLPGTNANHIVSRRGSSGTNGWAFKNSHTTANSLDLIVLESGGGGYQISPPITFTADDVGKAFPLYFTVGGLGTGAVIRAHRTGVENGVGNACVGAPVVAASDGGICIGRYQHSTTFSSNAFSLISVRLSSTVMTPEQIMEDSEYIMLRTSRLVFPVIPGEVERYVAKDIASVANWHDRVGDDLTLTLNGSPTVQLV